MKNKILITSISLFIIVIGYFIYNDSYKSLPLEQKKSPKYSYISSVTSDKKSHNELEALIYKWVKVNMKSDFAPRDGAGALVFNNKMWLLGGWNPDDNKSFPMTTNNEVWSSTNGFKWKLEKENTFLNQDFNRSIDWEGRHTAGYVVHNNKMWIVGGDCAQGSYQQDVWNSDDGVKWSLVSDSVPWSPRVLHYTVSFNNKIWVIGGQTIPDFAYANETYYSDVWNSEDGITWKRVVPTQPAWKARGMIGGSVVFKGKMWILGGGTYDSIVNTKREYYNDVWSSEDGVEWKIHTYAKWRPRSYHSVAVFDDKMWVIDGFNDSDGNKNDVWFSDDGVEWTELPNTPWKKRHAASIYVYDNALWVVTGNNMQSDVWKLVKDKVR